MSRISGTDLSVPDSTQILRRNT